MTALATRNVRKSTGAGLKDVADMMTKFDRDLALAEGLARSALQRQRDLIEQVRNSRVTMKVMLIAKLEGMETDLQRTLELIVASREIVADLAQGGDA